MPFSDHFRAAMQDVANAINDEMGETVIITPYVAMPNYSSTLDANRPAFSVTAVFTHKAVTTFGNEEGHHKTPGRRETLEVGISTSRPIFSVKSCDLPFDLRPSYRIQRCHNGSLYEITDIRPDGVSRIEIRVVQLGRRLELERASAA